LLRQELCDLAGEKKRVKAAEGLAETSPESQSNRNES